MEEILSKIKSNQRKIADDQLMKKIEFEQKKISAISNLKSAYKNKAIDHQDLMIQASGIAERFKTIYLKKLSWLDISDDDKDFDSHSKKYWINTMISAYNKKIDIENIYDFWLDVYNKISTIPSIHNQGKKYSELTKSLNPGQLVQCDFYRAIQTFMDHKFEILQVDESLENFSNRVLPATPAVFFFIIRKKNWIAQVNFFDDNDCISGILRSKYIIDMNKNIVYEGEDFYAWNSIEANTISIIDMFDIGYDAMMDKRYGHLYKLENFLFDKGYIKDISERSLCSYNNKIFNNKCCYAINVPEINPLTIYLHLDYLPNKIILSLSKYIFIDKNQVGIKNNGKDKTLIIEFNHESDMENIKQEIDCFLYETNPGYMPNYLSNDGSIQTLKSLTDFYKTIDIKPTIEIEDLSNLYKGLIIYQKFTMTNKYLYGKEYRQMITMVSLKYDKSNIQNLCQLDIESLEQEIQSNNKNPRFIDSLSITKYGTLADLIDQMIYFINKIVHK